MTTPHYHISVYIPGYLPEGDIETYLNKTAAIEALKWRKEEILDQDAMLDENPRRMHGDARRDLGYFYHDPDDPFDQGLVIQAYPCIETDEEEYE